MADRVFSVTQLTLSIKKNLLANNAKIADAWIEGEISGNKIYSSGHRYFTLKDKDASINCVLFAFHLRGCDAAFRAQLAAGEETVNGLKVQVRGELDVNMTRGQYAFKAQEVRIAGLGDKMAQFNALKAKLEAEGLNKLDHPQLRRPLPFLPRRIGIVTSPAGAVIHDMCDVLNRRFPNVEIRLYPAKVQGDGAAESLVRGVRFFNGQLVPPDVSWRPDVIIVARGGGSAEDLWVFNEEPVVRAVAASQIPIVSAVGHESDTTLCDHVADLRAGTPSIAAERVVPEKTKLAAQVDELRTRLDHALRNAVEDALQRVDHLSYRLTTAPKEALTRTERRLDNLAARLAPAVKEAWMDRERRLQRAALRLDPPMRRAVEKAAAALERNQKSLELLNPYRVLERGYSITTDAAGRVVRAASDVGKGAHLITRLGDGQVESVAV